MAQAQQQAQAKQKQENNKPGNRWLVVSIGVFPFGLPPYPPQIVKPVREPSVTTPEPASRSNEIANFNTYWPRDIQRLHSAAGSPLMPHSGPLHGSAHQTINFRKTGGQSHDARAWRSVIKLAFDSGAFVTPSPFIPHPQILQSNERSTN